MFDPLTLLRLNLVCKEFYENLVPQMMKPLHFNKLRLFVEAQLGTPMEGNKEMYEAWNIQGPLTVSLFEAVADAFKLERPEFRANRQ